MSGEDRPSPAPRSRQPGWSGLGWRRPRAALPLPFRCSAAALPLPLPLPCHCVASSLPLHCHCNAPSTTLPPLPLPILDRPLPCRCLSIDPPPPFFRSLAALAYVSIGLGQVRFASSSLNPLPSARMEQLFAIALHWHHPGPAPMRSLPNTSPGRRGSTTLGLS